MKKTEWTQMVTDEKTGTRVLVLTTLVNGITVAPEDLGDEDALSEANDY